MFFFDLSVIRHKKEQCRNQNTNWFSTLALLKLRLVFSEMFVAHTTFKF